MMVERLSSRNGHCSKSTIPLKQGELGLFLSGEARLSGDRLVFLWLSVIALCGVGDEVGPLQDFAVAGLPFSPNVSVAFIGPCFVDGDAIRRILLEDWLAIFGNLVGSTPTAVFPLLNCSVSLK